MWRTAVDTMKINAALAFLLMTPLLPAVEWSIEQCSALDLLAGRTGVADVRPSNDPHHNSDQMLEQNSGIYRGQWSWQSEMPELLYGMMHSGEAAKVSPSGFTALQAACVYADENIFRALMEAGVPVDTRPGDWQQLGYVGDTPLGLLVRFMHPRTEAARLRMARVLLEKGANPDAPMTTWKGNRVVTTVPFCEMGRQECNHKMRMLLLEFGEQDLKKRTASWPLDWDAYRPELVKVLRRGGISKKSSIAQLANRKTVVGQVPLLDLIRKGDVEGVRQALDSGVSIEVSPRARRYGQEPLFNIPVRYKDSPEDAVEIARMLIDAGADINALNRRGKSLRIHYDRYRSKASRDLCAYLKERGSLVHPDSPQNVEKLAAAHAERDANLRRRQEELLKTEEVVQPQVEEPAPAPQPEQSKKPDMDPSQKLMLEVQAQLAELQAKYEAEQKAREAAEQQQQNTQPGENQR